MTQHFSLEELEFSETAVRQNIDNTAPPDIIPNLEVLANGLEQIRTALGDKPITISSGYRSPALNKAVGGSSSSAHTQGFAADFVCWSFGTPLEICRTLEATDLQFDQLINEGKWVHVSFAPAMRQEILTATFTATGTVYQHGLA